MSSTPDVLVVGAGVIGLTAAVCLAEQGSRVRIWARLPPGATTSAVASAMVGPSFHPADDPDGQRERVSVAEFTGLAGVAGTGVALRRGRLASVTQTPAPPGLSACDASELPDGFAAAFWTTLPLVDMPVYLDHLAGRLRAAGGEIELRDVATLAEPAAHAPLVLDCAGLGARELVPDPAVRSIRGQHVVVENPGIEEFFVGRPDGTEWTAYWPYPEHVVLGGVAGEDDENTVPDPNTAEQIRLRCIAVEPRLAGAAVLSHQVGLRPARPTVRLDAELVGDARVVHCYGHGGAGVTLSWGCAREAIALLTA